MEAMYDMHADPTAISAAFGLHVPLLEVDDVLVLYETVTEDEIQDKIKVIDAEFDMPEPKSDSVTSKLTDADKYQAAKSAVALDKLVEKYQGKPGSGASVEFKIKEGPITMLGITQNAKGGFKFVIGEDISKEGPTHHYALGIGHHAETIAKIADILGIEHVIVK